MGEWSPFRAYAQRKKSIFRNIPDGVALLFLVTLAIFAYAAADRLPAYQWNWKTVVGFLYAHDPAGHPMPGLLLQGLLATIRIGFWTILFSLFLGGIAGVFSLRRSRWIRLPLACCINLLRNTPPLVILFCVYFFAGNLLPVSAINDVVAEWPPFAQDLVAYGFAPPAQMDAMIAAVLALGAYQAAYVAEIVRGGLSSVPVGQWDAAMALGFSRWQAMRWIIFPQALRLIIPPMTGQCISTFKESALASLISLPELTFQSLEIMAVSNMTFEIWITSAFLYLALGMFCAWTGAMLEKRYSL